MSSKKSGKKLGNNSTSKAVANSAEEPDLKLPAWQIHPARQVLNCKDLTIEMRKLYEISNMLWLPENIDEDEKNARVIRALELYERLDPADGAEGMLATQMVGTHFAALDCLRRAAISEQSFDGRDLNLKHAQKLMTLYTQQLAALNKHRGKGQQRVTVEHVNVEPGGQAIVGTVETKGNAPRGRSIPNALSNDAEVWSAPEPEKDPVPRKQK